MHAEIKNKRLNLGSGGIKNKRALYTNLSSMFNNRLLWIVIVL
jgi:hypothetical protein